MFSGIVEEVGRVANYNPSNGALSIKAPRVLFGDDGLRVSDSVSVSGACLTVTSLMPDSFMVDISPETKRCTWFAEFKSGTHVNLERAIKYNSRIGGHLVQGHVDGIGRVVEVKHEGDAKLITVESLEDITRYVVEKGFVAIDGVSLTTFDCEANRFTFSLIPFTAIHSTLGVLRPGDTVNIETDLTGKYIERFVAVEGS